MGISTLLFTAPGLPQPAFKKKKGDKDKAGWPVTVEDGIGPKGGKLTIKADGPEKHDKLEVKFVVPGKALEQERQIVMTAQGTPALSGLELVFKPSGVTFAKPAQLQITLQKDLVDVPRDVLNDLVIWHVNADGDVEKVEAKVEVGRGGTVKIKLLVHSFSVYSLPPGR